MRYIVHKGFNFPSGTAGEEIRVEPTATGITIELSCPEKVLKILLGQKTISVAPSGGTVRNIRDIERGVAKKGRG